MKIWGVRNFYSNLERISEAGSEFSLGFFALAVASSILATGGLLINSIPVIIGAMCVAPFLGASRAVCVGGAYKKQKTLVKGLVKQIFGLCLLGSAIAFFVTVAFFHLVPGIIVTPEIMARTIPTLKDIYLSMLIAITSGAAASLALVTTQRMWGRGALPYQELRLMRYPRMFDVTIGVEIAISLIPPASVVGIGLAFGRFDIFLHSLTLLLVNIWGLDIGGLIVLILFKVERKSLQLEKRIREIVQENVNDVLEVDTISSVIVLHSYKRADVRVSLYAFEIREHTDRLLAERISREIRDETGVSNNVKIVTNQVCQCTSKII